jgi:hypothetical protein
MTTTPAPFPRPARLYHGTSEKRARRAMLEGLMPRGANGRVNHWKHTVGSNPRAVYLTDTYALYFASAATHGNQRWAVIEIDTAALDEDLLRVDEDALEQFGRNGVDGLPDDWDMKRRTMYYRRRARHNPNWTASLEALGTCAHYGTIPPEAFTRVAFLDWRQHSSLALACADASISRMGFKFCGGDHRARVQWLFGDPFDRAAAMGLSAGGAQLPVDMTGMMGDFVRSWEMILADRRGIEVLDMRVRLKNAKRKRA